MCRLFLPRAQDRGVSNGKKAQHGDAFALVKSALFEALPALKLSTLDTLDFIGLLLTKDCRITLLKEVDYFVIS